ncbi:MAG TPA: 2-iminoacetate synthase ThiH [Chthoniobacteraceae bacterium]|jgi:2-iminoacetate synthase|nr:biotin and thiamine synthesis associated [Chthoniobacter sp.]HEV7869161.1 2-iminoacetate synthase ThiH [Chthoniobacteraceae bacterium]
MSDFLTPSRLSPTIRKFQRLLAPMDNARLEALAQESAAATRRNFGKAIRLFAPLYLSNECINNCQYCGFSRDNAILRVTLDVAEVMKEARHLAREGFRNILLVAGEHPRFVSSGYLEECVRALAAEIPTIALEVAPMEVHEYAPLVAAGAEGLVVYQETYDRSVYAEMHTSGPKKDFDWRLACPERAYEAGFRRIGIGALFGLAEWRTEAVALAQHLEHLLRRCWKAQFTISLPRLRPCAGEFEPRHRFEDREMVQLICALRVCFPHVGLVLSTREPAALRDALAPLGITTMSAGSHTEPGGYTGAGQENLHLTTRGKAVSAGTLAPDTLATGQFEIADERSPAQVAALLKSCGLEAVWKDWDAAILDGSAAFSRD